jgi:non-specific serine/threonine protein kinase
LRTFLIADVRGYTRFTYEQGDEAAARLAARFADVVAEEVAVHGGEVVELRGDEALVVFPSARNALRAALALQARFKQEIEENPSLPLEVGMGLDAGEAIAVKGGYRGGVLNLAARLCSLAARGEVFASEAVIHLARKTEGLSYVDRGEVQFKGLPNPVRVLQVGMEGAIPTELPPLQQKLFTHPTNLPDESTPFIGRGREIDAIAGLLQKPKVRLVTLTGPGGTGKTRLALQVGATLLHDFDNGVFLVSLAASNPGLVASAIAGGLGIKEVPGQSLEETLAHYLRKKHCLLILDNFEHLLDACPLVVTLLDQCPTLKVLITRQTVLHLSREHVFEVPPLSIPNPHRLPDLESLRQYEAVALFILRAQAATADFEITDESAPAVAAICSRLDGLPLAIELAAARIRLFPPQALLGRLSGRLKLLTGGARDLPARHQTLRGTIDWSYSLLTEAEQRLFVRLSVFAGGCTLEAVDAVCYAEEDLNIDVTHGVASLVDKSLLRQDPSGVPVLGGDPRLAMLESLREYAAELLEAAGEAEQIRHRHASYFIALAEQAEADMLEGRQLRAWLDRLEAEHDNLREAIGWLLRTGRTVEALRLTGALYPFWNARGHWREGRGWLDAALASGEAPDAIRAKALAGVGTIAGARQHDFAYARARLEDALSLWQQLGDPTRTELVLTGLAITAYQQGDEQWRAFYAEAFTHLPEIPTTSWQAVIHFNLGLLAYIARDLDQAQHLFESALALSRRAGHDLYTTNALGFLARLAFDQGDLPPARTFARDALHLAHLGQYALALMNCLDVVAGIAVSAGDVERAAHLYGAVEALQQTTGGLLLPEILIKRQPLVEAARAQIGEVAWETAWQEGRLMPLDQVLALASEDTDQALSKLYGASSDAAQHSSQTERRGGGLP